MVVPLRNTTPRRQKGQKNRQRAVVPLDLTVLPLGVAVLLLTVEVLLLASGTKKLHPGLPPQDMGRVFGPERYYRLGDTVVLL